MMPLKPLVEPTNSRPQSVLGHKAALYTVLFSNFQQSSWLLAAALLQGMLTLLFPTILTLLPSFLILGSRVLDMILITYGYRPNPYMDGVIQQKVSAQCPDGTGNFGEKPSSQTVVVLFLGSKSNHPLGILSPGYRETVKLFTEMVRDMEANREEYTYITSTSWISNSDPTCNAAREVMTVFYFQSMDGLHKFAHGPIHRKGWDWWNRTAKEHPDISIMHEVYEAPAGHWENIYMNYKPSGFATGKFPIKSRESSHHGATEGKTGHEPERQWIGNIVDASKMNMKSSNIRLGRE
ncbi:hypothetical protein P175DRAFT_0484756 [Aspergillus ochraceoroseus IBT 24754]|uniref:Monooxygenase n=1 Tax=Aspergillus ochraceoroseus IBT 24754 TaxID=1392256 RepID=A0A2T5LRU4_9EURO|nr:uncharacterized protein P175DRAFT_0484756 [Aspergillus ochraceoroseus IBT 24754]PTU19000.1 hypothetical protein P175DRAFT_0484756 [Aspergillus ochraceoroseus IBT 24754]